MLRSNAVIHVNMSLLRVCAFAKCVNRRSLFEKCAFRLSFADSCQLCVSRRSGAVRRISGEPKESSISITASKYGCSTMDKFTQFLRGLLC